MQLPLFRALSLLRAPGLPPRQRHFTTRFLRLHTHHHLTIALPTRVYHQRWHGLRTLYAVSLRTTRVWRCGARLEIAERRRRAFS